MSPRDSGETASAAACGSSACTAARGTRMPSIASAMHDSIARSAGSDSLRVTRSTWPSSVTSMSKCKAHVVSLSRSLPWSAQA
jgi:hypothetical protein